MEIMKKVLLFVALALAVTPLWSQDKLEKPKEDRNFRIPLLGEIAPSFTAETTHGLITFPSDFGSKWKILFSHPGDFTPVCTSEILELANLQPEFDKLGVKIAVISADPVKTHEQWIKIIEELNFKERGPVKIKFPLIGDENLVVSKQYGMIHAATNTTQAVRGVFIIDPDNIIQAIYFYPMNVGRSTDELIRMVTALQTTSSAKVCTPANWQAGNDVLVPYNPNTVHSNPEVAPEGFYSLTWFMWYKKAN
jgi:peroxiredoxin 2/4